MSAEMHIQQKSLELKLRKSPRKQSKKTKREMSLDKKIGQLDQDIQHLSPHLQLPETETNKMKEYKYEINHQKIFQDGKRTADKLQEPTEHQACGQNSPSPTHVIVKFPITGDFGKLEWFQIPKANTRTREQWNRSSKL